MRSVVTDRVLWSVCQYVTAVNPAKWLNQSRWRLGCGLWWAKGSISSIVFTRWRQTLLFDCHCSFYIAASLSYCIVCRSFMTQHGCVYLCIYRCINSLFDVAWAKGCGRIKVNGNFRCLERGSTLLHFAWVVDDAKCIVVTRACVSVCLCVCVSVCLSVRGRSPTLLHESGCNLGAW